MGNSSVRRLKESRFEEVLHSSIQAALLSDSQVPRPIFTQLYLEAGQLGHRQEAETEDEDGEDDMCSKPSGFPSTWHMKPPSEGHCTTDGFCQSGKDLRLASIGTASLDAPPGFLLVGAKSPLLPDDILVCAVDCQFVPDESRQNVLLGFRGNCVGCGQGGFRYFTEFSVHINLKTVSRPTKQKHLWCYLRRDASGRLVAGMPICWRSDGGSPAVVQTDHLASPQTSRCSPSSSSRDLGTQTNTVPPKKRHKGSLEDNSGDSPSRSFP